MKLLQVHNHYRYRGGEDVMFEQICSILRDYGHDIATYERRSTDVSGVGSKVRAFVSGIYSSSAKHHVADYISTEKPDLVHVHNLYPMISPSILEACGAADIPVVMRCPNYRLACPTGLHLRNGAACARCSGGREYWCALTNCRGDIVESTAMAVRSMAVRTWGLIHKHVSIFVPPSAFVMQQLVLAGIPAPRIRVVPNTVCLPVNSCDPSKGQYIAFAGRLSEEKGVETLIEAARALPKVPVRIAGDGHLLGRFRSIAPKNVSFAGQLDHLALVEFYANARACVVPSVWHEAFGLVAAEAMAHGLPVIATRMGALPEIVDEATTGFLFDCGNACQLAEHMEFLWGKPEMCRGMGLAGREKVTREYSREVYYKRLLDVYSFAIGNRGAGAVSPSTLAQSA
ncbi:MAG TPA: glycosyltransferase family 4 protein [Candidatus Hydrogenedentes bacterium]|nr:glycosyltransferase family 4 protein [Candidatus Hydrogenedentota bacterium]HRK33107.1 glycosyltransferase family 4 protein [Candidatus Hydrogenedentota bacterium]